VSGFGCQKTDDRSQMTENSQPLIICHLFSVLCISLTPEH
jgi:hypothetical protein